MSAQGKPFVAQAARDLDAINSLMQEDVSGIRIIKACIREVTEKIRFGKANDELIKTQLKVLIIFAFMNPAMYLLMNGVVVIILMTGARQVTLGLTSTGIIMAAITYTTQLLNGILGLVMLFQSISRGAAFWKRVKEVLDTEPSLADGSFDGNTACKGEVEFRDMSFAFPGTGQTVLEHIDLRGKRKGLRRQSPPQAFLLSASYSSAFSRSSNIMPREVMPPSARYQMPGFSRMIRFPFL